MNLLWGILATVMVAFAAGLGIGSLLVAAEFPLIAVYCFTFVVIVVITIAGCAIAGEYEEE